jgi:uncharacterized protein YtpQ (UPF0354 family)
MNFFKKFRKQRQEKNPKESNQAKPDELKLGEIIYPTIKLKSDEKIVASKKTSNPIIYKHFAEDLVIAYSIDLGNTFELVSQDTAKEYNVSLEDFHMAAMRNLRKKVNTSLSKMKIDPPSSIEGGKSFTRILLDNNFDSSLVLVEELWPQFSEMVDDKVVGVSIPAKNILAISSFSDDNISYRTMRLFGKSMYKSSIKDGIEITDESYVWKDGEWYKFLDTEDQFLKLVS